jgi:hypothetical protein
MQPDGLTKVLFYSGMVVIVLGGLGSLFPLWKSRKLSPASIERRVYWTGCGIGSTLLFVSQLPDWRSGLIVAFAAAFVLALTAWRFTSHIKVGGKIYAITHANRQPDPPPALRET